MNLKRVLTIVGVLILCLAVFRIYYKITTGKKIQETRVIPVMVSVPKIGSIEYRVSLTGDVKGQKEVNVRSGTAGRVAEIYVNEGDHVQKGDKLLSFASGLSEQSDIYEDLIVRAPISGIVGMKLVKEGDQIGGGTGTSSNVFTLYDIDNVKIYADVSEKDYSFLRRGTPAEIALDAFPGEIFNGSVSNIRPVIDPLSRTTQAEIILPNPGHRIRPGMFGKVDLILKKKTGVPIIPFDAVMGDKDKYVFISRDGAAVKKPITLGMQQDNDVEVTSGLSGSDKVIVLGQRVVKEGAKVEEAKP